MEFKRLISKYVYHIEPKPGGGFIAHATDPGIPPLEAATRTELQQKIQAAIFSGLAQDLPGLKLPPQSSELKFSLHVERNPNGGFEIHSSDPNAVPLQAQTHDEVESHFAEKLVGLVGKHFAPELAQALAAQGGTGDIKVFVKKTGFTVTSGGNAAMQLLSNASPGSASATFAAPELATSPMPTAPVSGTIDATTSGPITPENDHSGALFKILLALLLVAGLIYFLFLRTH
jgi:hypothetical protein